MLSCFCLMMTYLPCVVFFSWIWLLPYLSEECSLHCAPQTCVLEESPLDCVFLSLYHEIGLLFSYLSLQHLEFSLFAPQLDLCFFSNCVFIFTIIWLSVSFCWPWSLSWIMMFWGSRRKECNSVLLFFLCLGLSFLGLSILFWIPN